MKKILFVHPDHKIVGIYDKYLSPHFQVDSATDGLSGLRMIKLHRPHLIVSDYKLRYMSGLSLLRFVRNHPEMYATPFLFLSREQLPAEALGMGANAWLTQGEHSPSEFLNLIVQHI